jgi:hypothetical protein
MMNWKVSTSRREWPWRNRRTIQCFIWTEKQRNIFLNLNFRRVLNVVCFLLGLLPGVCSFNADVSENSVRSLYLPMKMEQTECSETLAYKIQMPGDHPVESIQQKIYIQNTHCALKLHSGIQRQWR